MQHRQQQNPKNDHHKRFVETARQLECDEDKERSEEKLKRIATAKTVRKRDSKGNRLNNGIQMGSLWTRIFAGLILAPVLTSQAIAGFFPSRPPDAPVQKFTGVIVEYGLGNDTGYFVLTIGRKSMDFYIGLPMRINGAIVRCQDPDPDIASPGSCTDWPPSIVLGKSVVTATCWIEMFSPDMGAKQESG
jgi:hypothetical protein